MRSRGGLLPAAALALCCSCPILGSDEEPPAGAPSASMDRVPVVDDVGPFDPSEAVDDDDGPVVLAGKDDPTDQDAFEEDATEAADAAENERGDGEPGAPGEDVAQPAEVAARERERKRDLERAEEAGGDEDERKAELGHNPPPEPATESEPAWLRPLELALETLIVACVAALLSAAIVFARSHPRLVTAAAIGAAAAWFLSSQVG